MAAIAEARQNHADAVEDSDFATKGNLVVAHPRPIAGNAE
jgi:hypothetical protein